ncbi:type IV pilus assembly protein FimV [Janthinobacterium sp. PSPC3-1]|uniref:type IV pilus assembly protein FimV n=1 Tax=Janthinobacterium sp. PSPC3-1 TaxID=2804653 RepID=UPI003CEDEC64
MPSIVFSRWTATLCATACLAMPAAFAAELGDISVQSHVGQPLSADIELTALAPDELQGLPVRLASSNVYEGGGISMDAALQTLAISQVERDGRRFVHLSTRQAINAGHVHVYLVLGNGNRGVVRLATVWLTPTPPVPTVPVVVPAPVPKVVPQAPVPVLVSKPIAVPDAAALAARARAEGMLRPPAVFVAPPVASKPAFVPVSPPPLRRAPAPVAACAPQAAGVPAAACVALDRQNTALNEKIGVLEGKVSALQQALAAPAALAPTAPAAAVAPHVKAKAAVAEKKSGGNGLWWLGLGTVLFLLATAVIVYILRKRKGRAEAGPRPPSKYWVLLRKPFRRKPAPVAPPGDTVPERDEPALAPEPEPFSR